VSIGKAIASFLLLTLVTGCTPAFFGVFNSTLAEDITLEVRALTSDGKFEHRMRHKLAAGKRKRIHLPLAEVTATDSSGNMLFQQVLPFGKDLDKFRKQGEREVHFVVTRGGVFPIPVQWRDDWKAHEREIIEAFDVQASRLLLLKEATLKEP
jgi:hypothetical protein